MDVENQIVSSDEEHNETEIIYADADEVKSWFSIEDLTTDNWEDYFELVEDKTESTDAFGEGTGEYSVICRLALKENVSVSEGTAVRLEFVLHNEEATDTNKETGEISSNEHEDSQEQKDFTVFYDGTDWNRNMDTEVYYIEYQIDLGDMVSYSKNSISNLKCTKIQGTARKFIGDIPELAWNEPD